MNWIICEKVEETFKQRFKYLNSKLMEKSKFSRHHCTYILKKTQPGCAFNFFLSAMKKRWIWNNSLNKFKNMNFKLPNCCHSLWTCRWQQKHPHSWLQGKTWMTKCDDVGSKVCTRYLLPSCTYVGDRYLPARY